MTGNLRYEQCDQLWVNHVFLAKITCHVCHLLPFMNQQLCLRAILELDIHHQQRHISAACSGPGRGLTSRVTCHHLHVLVFSVTCWRGLDWTSVAPLSVAATTTCAVS